MKPLAQDLINRLDLEAALHQERETVRNLLPTEPGLKGLTDNSVKFREWLVGQLRSGMDIAPNHVVSARKHGVGTRPVPIVGIPGRVLYRALTEELLRDRPSVDRTQEAYSEFVAAPVMYARELDSGDAGWKIGQSGITHVVKSDLAAFYEYVDHEILIRELLAVSPDFDAADALRELLYEMEGRTFGLPQLLDPSDELSDLYADIVERGLLREGFQTWRFNDDFRIASASYSEALRAIEALGRHARHLGLVIVNTRPSHQLSGIMPSTLWGWG
ncbi:MAG: hypothetical protein GEU79_03430 [Acidimicrobiia bacterium]|nr:hypothetical protein [Acidimicrobiia bacterium]